ncbi:MAG: ribulokinase [bacterium]|nr:ribulokinase [bacterium]
MSGKYVIGVDYGTESGRAVLVEIAGGREVASAVWSYGDGVIDDRLPGSGRLLEPDWALQNPLDYIEVLKRTIPAVLSQSGVSPDNVIGVGTDFTACTMLPVKADGTPLCTLPEYAADPHAWVKLWKHHAAQPEADAVNALAAQRREPWLSRYGGRISSEWFLPKAWQILNEAPDIYAAADRLIEAADWIVWQLTGQERRNSCSAGYKALWHKRDGYPAHDFLRALDPRLEFLVEEKLCGDVYPLGVRAGGLTPAMAALTGLREGTAVCVGNVDAHVAVPACTVTGPGKLVMIMGTSLCHMVMGHDERMAEGICGVVEDGIVPGYFGYEAGQSAVGDIFAWFTENCAPYRGQDVHARLEEAASRLKPGQSGLLALDWWNGNRSVLVNADLTGMILGCTLSTRPEEIYRALIEATAFGTNKIIKSFTENGINIDEIFVCGGLPQKNRMLMQIFADVTGREMRIAASAQTPALGSAMHAAVAAGPEKGGYAGIAEAAAGMASLKAERFVPDKGNREIYGKLFAEYERLHDYFGRGENDVMKRLKEIRLGVTAD